MREGTKNLCKDVAASWVPSVAAAASSGTSVRCSGRNFGICTITVVLVIENIVMDLQRFLVLYIVMNCRRSGTSVRSTSSVAAPNR